VSKSVATGERESPGPAAFGSLRAEDESWLSECFAPPPQFERVTGQCSTIVFGAPGSGKTALYRELRARSRRAEGRPARLLVEWRPAPLPPGAQSDLAWVKPQAALVLDACAVALARHLIAYSDDYSGASESLQARLTWFIRRFITQGNPALRLGALAEGSAQGAALVRLILDAPVYEALYEDAALHLVAAELVDVLSALGLDGLWVMSDGLEGWAKANPAGLSASLSAFLSTLSLFECPGLAYKLCVPSSLEPELSRTAGLARRRVDGVHLHWDAAALRRLVERRLAFSAGRETFELEQLCDAPGFLEWLEKVGGTSPRAWLDQVAPLARRYLNQPHPRPIDDATWKQLRRDHPPRLHLDEERHMVTVGGREIELENVPTKAYDMLCYLYGRAGQIVTKAELYFLVYRGLDAVPRSPADEHYQGRKEYEGLVDTNIYRLRQALEPDPSDHVLLVAKRGHGLVLNVRW